jgi:hypothetical protein
MKKTGYVVVDCTGINLLAESEVTVDGIYAKCKDAFDSGKPIFACNCVYGTGVPATPIQVMAILEAGTYILTSSILQVRVASDDGVTITSLLT